MNSILQHIEPFKNKRQVIIHNQSIGDIMNGILHTHKIHSKDYDNFANLFNAGTDLGICKKIYDYLKQNTFYKIEPDHLQTLRSPAAILMLGKNPNIGLDCKSYSLFIGGVLDALNRKGKNINWCYRFASYKAFDKLPHHVFVVVNPNTKNEIWCDPVINNFNLHKPYTYKIDKKMSLVTISGIGRRSKADRKKRKAEVINKVKGRMKRGLKLLVKLNPATLASRNAFLLMVKLNLFGLARNLVKVQQQKESELKKFWEKIGGNYSSLVKSINEGKNKGHHKANGVGALPAIAAAIAAATPIILKIKSLLKSVGVNTDDIVNAAKGVVQNVAKNKLDEFAERQIDQEDQGGGNQDFSSEPIDENSNDISNDDSDSFVNDDSGNDSESDGEIAGIAYPSYRRSGNKKVVVERVVNLKKNIYG